MVNGYIITIETIITFGSLIVVLLITSNNFNKVKKSIGEDAAWKSKVDTKLEDIAKDLSDLKKKDRTLAQLEVRVERLERENDMIRKLGGAVYEPLLGRRDANVME